MMISTSNILIALLWAAAAAAATWLVLLPVRRRWLGGLLVSVVLTGITASLAALFAGIHEMLIPVGQWLSLLLLTLAAGTVAAIAAGLAARRITSDNRTLRRAITELGAGEFSTGPRRRLTAELETIRAELEDTARALHETRDRERSLESARRELVAWMSHDLRTPLAGLRAMSEALEDGVASDPALYYKQIAAAVNRISGMVDDLFELSRIQSAGLTRDTEHIPLSDLISDCVAALSPLAHARGVHLQGRTGGPLTTLGSSADLNRALTNLIANAIRHTRSNGVVTVALSTSDAALHPERLAVVTVSDECGGIPEHDLPHVFDVGFRGEAARTPATDPHAHAGLGLAITQGIIEAHSGTLDVHNTSTGCAFRVLLPVAA